MMQHNDENSWRTPAFRQNVIHKIEEAISKSGMPTSRSSNEMENHVYQKARSKDEYLGYVARLILHVRDSNAIKKAQIGQQSVQVQQQQQQQPPGQSVQDPINALRTLAHQGSGNQMMNIMPQQNPPQLNASNLLQTLNQRPRIPGPQGMQVRIASNPPNMLGSPQMLGMGGTGGQVSVVVSQMNSGTSTLPPQMSMGGPPMMQGAPSISSAGPMGQMMPNQAAAIQAQMNQLAAQRNKAVADSMVMTGQGTVSYRCPLPNQFVRQGTPPPSGPPQQQPPGMSVSMAQSPGLPAAPAQMMLSSGPGFPGPPIMRQPAPGPIMAPSPNSVNLNTPGGLSHTAASPCSNDDRAYWDKIKQLSKYIEPLSETISQMGPGDAEKMSKMKKLLEILSSPGQRMAMETLLKCEKVLEKLDFKCLKPSTSTTQATPNRDPLIEAINQVLQSPNPNHTLKRTFEPFITAICGKQLKTLPKPLERKPAEDQSTDIPDILQGEVARLDQRFKVSLDSVMQSDSKQVHLICWLDDRHLPCLPPMHVSIPEDYPSSSPKYYMSTYEYNTDFLQLIQSALSTRVAKLPAHFTLSQLLDTWEMSVRECCSGNKIENVGDRPILMGF